MISIETYNAAEATAVQEKPQLHQDSTWGVVKETTGHLIWVHQLNELKELINRYQRDRFCTYMYELGGMSEEILRDFTHACNTVTKVQNRHFDQSILPIETLLSSMCIYHKIKAARPKATTILEIGPGAGLNSVFFANDPLIRNYTQIEATQSLYLLQAMISDECYEDIWESAQSDMVWPPHSARLWHIPWWRVDDLYNKSIYYDVVTANACLNEISDAMIDRYLKLIKAKSHDNTLLLIQCTGAPYYRTEEQLKIVLTEAGWHLNAQQSGRDIEQASSGGGVGEAVHTWWFTRRTGEAISKFVRCCDASLCTLNANTGAFILPNNEQWDKKRFYSQ